MRAEVQPWDAPRVTFELVDELGAGVTGLNVQAYVRRLSDGLYLQPSGNSWGASAAGHTLSAVDATNLPGLYSYAVGSTACDVTAGGYFARVLETTYGAREHVLINTQLSADDAWRVLALRQDNTRVLYESWSSGGVPLTGQVLVYPDAAAVLADADPWPGATGSWAFEATVDGQGRVTAYVSTRST